MFLPDEDGARTAGLTHGDLSVSVDTETVTLLFSPVVAAWNADTLKVSLSVETFFVFIRADGGVLTLVNITATQAISSQLEPAVTADEAARSVEAVLTLLTARALLTLICVSAGVVICPQVVARQAAPPAPHRVDTNLLLTAVINISAALVNIPALLAVSQVFVARLAG